MAGVQYKRDASITSDQVKNLYDDAGWFTYTEDMPRLMEGIGRSLYTVTAWDNDRLVGLIRVVGEGLTIIYIQDLLVLQTHRRKGIGTKLVRLVCEEYSGARQKVLLTEDAPEMRAFYQSLGFEPCDRGRLVAFARFD